MRFTHIMEIDMMIDLSVIFGSLGCLLVLFSVCGCVSMRNDVNKILDDASY